MESIPSNTTLKKKVKLFNRHYQDMQDGLKISLRRPRDRVYSVKTIDQVNDFSSKIEENIELYNEKNIQLFDKVLLLNRVFFGKPSLSNANKVVVWKFIEILYSLSKEENKHVATKDNNADLSSLIGSLMNDQDSGFKSLVDDISTQVQSSIQGKNINEQQIISDLMSGNMNSSGIDFKKIIEQTSEKLKGKVDRGEIDINKLKETGDKINSIIPRNNN